MVKMTKAQCSKAGKALAKNGTSAAGRSLAQCRWGKSGAKAKAKVKPKTKAAPPPARKSRRLQGMAAETVRKPEPPRKPRKKGPKKKAGGKSSAGLRKVENKLVPGLNPPPGDMRNFLAEQRRLYGV